MDPNRTSTDLSYHQDPYPPLDNAGGKVDRNQDKLILNIEAVRKLRAAGEENLLLTLTRFSRTATQLPLNMIAVSCFSNHQKFMLDMSYSSYQIIKIALGLRCAARISKPHSRKPRSSFWLWGWKMAMAVAPLPPQQNLNRPQQRPQTSTEPQQRGQTSTEPQQNTQTSTDLNRT